MKTIITNVVLSNSGDAAILRGICKALIEQGIGSQDNVVVFDSNSAATSSLYPDLRVRQLLTIAPPSRIRGGARLGTAIRRAFVRRLAAGSSLAKWAVTRTFLRHTSFGQTYAEFADADLVISTGGTYLVDHYDFESRAEELELARHLGKPVYLWTQSMGPFESVKARRSIERIIAVTDRAYLRDARSEAYWRGVAGRDSSAVVAADAAFALEPLPRSSNATERRVIISVREWRHSGPTGESFDEAAYRGGLREAALRAAARGYDVTAMSTCQGIAGYLDDSVKAREYFEDMAVVVDGSFHTPEGLLSAIADSPLVVTTRMHLAILALVAGVPVVAIAYEFKTMELFESLGLGRFVLPIDAVTPERLGAIVDDVLSNPVAAILSPSVRAQVRADACFPAREIAERMTAGIA